MPVFPNNLAISRLNQKAQVNDLDAFCIAGGADLLIGLGLSILYFEAKNRSPSDILESNDTFCVGNRRSVCFIRQHRFSVCFYIASVVVFDLYHCRVRCCGWLKTKIEA